MDGTSHEFAMLITVTPANREMDWERIIRVARPEPGMSITIRNPKLLFCVVSAEHEFVAIDRVERWLSGLATRAFPPLTLGFNAQPSEEIQ